MFKNKTFWCYTNTDTWYSAASNLFLENNNFFLKVYFQGEEIYLTCISNMSQPAASLSWTVNNKPVQVSDGHPGDIFSFISPLPFLAPKEAPGAEKYYIGEQAKFCERD